MQRDSDLAPLQELPEFPALLKTTLAQDACTRCEAVTQRGRLFPRSHRLHGRTKKLREETDGLASATA